jgi:hypothetical protein
MLEQLEGRDLLSGLNLAEVPLLDGEREDPDSRLIHYLGGNLSAAAGATFDYTEASVHSGRGAYEMAIDGTLGSGGVAFVQMTLGATGFGDPYLDTRDLTHYGEVAFWIRNATGTPFTLELGIKDFEDSNARQVRWIQPVMAADQWIEVRASLDLLPRWVGPAQAGWMIDGPVDLTRARSLSLAIVANQGSAVTGSVWLDDLRLVEPGEAIDPTVYDVDAMVVQLARRQFDALWGVRDRTTGLLPTISAYQDVMATNVTAALVKSLPGAVQRGWIGPSEADSYVETLVDTLHQMLDKAHHLPARYVDRVSLNANFHREESSVDAAIMYLALYQYQARYETPAALRDGIGQLLDRFDFRPFATARGWRMALDLSTGAFAPWIYDGYSGEIGLISLAAHLAGQADMAALYHSGTFRDSFPSLDDSFQYVMHASDQHQAPFMQWLLPLFVDVSGRGPDNYPDSDLASNPLTNAIGYQTDVIARLDDRGRLGCFQPDAGNDWRSLPENYRAYSVFNDFGQPSLYMPWSVAFGFLADPAAAEAALRQLLQAGLHGPFGLVDSAFWDDGQPAPRDVAARTDLWNTSLSLLAFQQYLYQDNRFLTSVPEVAAAFDPVFRSPQAISPAVQFLMDSADYACTSRIDGDAGRSMVPVYTDYLAGGDYLHINDVARMTLDGNDPNAAEGRTSFRATWNETGASGYFQFGFGTLGPRDIRDFGFVHRLQFFVKGDTQGQQVAVNVFRTTPGGGWQKLATAPAVITLTTSFQPFVIDMPSGIKPADLHAVQFVLGDGLPAGNGTFWLDEVRLMTDGCDPARLVQSYRADLASQAERDVSIYPNRSFLYDNALVIKALWATGDVAARATARQVADAIVATVRPDGSYYNQRNAGHALLHDGLPRPPYVQTRTLGDNAWFGLALLALHESTGEAGYLDRARAISDWAEADLKDDGAWGGYRGGFGESGSPFPWRATEHNVDLFALNQRLADALSAAGDPEAAAYADRATYAGDFVMRMFDHDEGKFWTGTGVGDTINTSSVPLDAQLWSAMALGVSEQYAAAVDWSRPVAWSEAHLRAVDGPYSGFNYSDRTTAHRVWFEGTAQAAVLYAVQGGGDQYAETMQEVEFARMFHPQGDELGLVAASSDDMIDAELGAVYDARLHAGATAWLVLAQQQVNPFVSLADNSMSPPRARLNSPELTVVADSSYQPGLDPLPGFNLVSWWNFGAQGTSKWEAAVDDLYTHDFRAVSLIPVRYVDLATGAISGGQKAPEIAHIAAGIARAKSLGMTVTVNPMVEPEDFSQWRGEMQFDGAAADRFFQEYQDYLVAVATAAAAAGADRMTVGSELKGLTAGHAAHWNNVIEAVATAFHGSLGYAANWDEYTNANLTEAIWESPHIDFVGIDLYPPLATEAQADASGEYPDAAFIEIVQANWERALHNLRDFAAARKSGRGMPLVLTELGVTPYNRGSTEPWSDRFQQPDSAEQANVFDALLRATDETGDWLPEFYAWHWPMDGAAGSKFPIHPDDPLSGSTAQLLQEHVRMEREDFGSHRLSVTYSDPLGINLSSLDNDDILVTGPNGYAQPATLVQASSGPDGTPRSATYRIAAPGGVWEAADYGTYHVLMQPDQVFNLQGNPVPAGAIGSFRFDPAPWQFRPNHFDVDASGVVVPLDVLRLINEINQAGSRRLDLPPAWQKSPPPYLDVNGDNWLTPLDVLLVINHINARSAAGGETEAADFFWWGACPC